MNSLLFVPLQETNKILSGNNYNLQNENKDLTDKAIMLEMSLNQKDQELQEMKNILESKSQDLKSALKLVEVGIIDLGKACCTLDLY